MDENNVNQTVNESTVPEQPKLGWNWGVFTFTKPCTFRRFYLGICMWCLWQQMGVAKWIF